MPSVNYRLPPVCCKRGAPMGRPAIILEPEAAVRFHLRKMRMVAGGYDTGGAYWGASSPAFGGMWHAFGDGPLYVNELFVRARNREEAKQYVLKVFPRATFYR